MLEKIIELTNEYIESMLKKERKKYGQFFTSMETARFMAGLYKVDEKTGKVSVLDAGLVQVYYHVPLLSDWKQ